LMQINVVWDGISRQAGWRKARGSDPEARTASAAPNIRAG